MPYMISIITPAYNAEKHIGCMIQSVLNQPINVELIIVNDGATDETGRICEEFCVNNANIKYISTSNFGAGHARNVGIQNATGEYVVFLDSDDLLFDNVINSDLIAYLEKCKSQKIDIIYTTKSKTDMELKRPLKNFQPEAVEKIKHYIPRLEFWTCIYRRNYLLSRHINFFEYRRQDIETAFRFRAFSRTSRIVVKPDIAFYLQRDNLESNTHTFNYYQLFSIKSKVYYELMEELEWVESNCDQYERTFLQCQVVQWIYSYFKYIRENGWDPSETEEQISQMQDLWGKQKSLSLQQLMGIGIRETINYYLHKIYVKHWIADISSLTKRIHRKSKYIQKTNIDTERLSDEMILSKVQVLSRQVKIDE